MLETNEDLVSALQFPSIPLTDEETGSPEFITSTETDRMNLQRRIALLTPTVQF
jgi:hypothetical protein